MSATLEIRLGTPKPFSGERRELRNFMFIFDRIFDVFKDQFPDDKPATKIAFVGSYLEGLPLTWYRNIWTKEKIEDYPTFIALLKARFGESEVEISTIADAKLKQITQGTRSVLEYSAEFEELAVDSTFKAVDEVIVRLYLRGLHQDILLAIAAGTAVPASLTEAIDEAVRIEDRLRLIQFTKSYSDEL